MVYTGGRPGRDMPSNAELRLLNLRGSQRDFVLMLHCTTTGLTSCIHAGVGDESKPPGVVIDHLPQSSGLYIGSPALAVLPNGSYVASHDIFSREEIGPYSINDTTRVFGSSNKGAT